MTKPVCLTGPMVTAGGTRIGWGDVPEHVRDEIARIVGSPIVATESQSGGFSPGAAERLVGSDGRRAFVKAANADLNEGTPGIYRRELSITAALPAAAPATTLLGSYDDGDWVALILADVEGRHPLTPWQSGEITAVLQMLQDLADQLTPVPDGLVVPRAEDELREDFRGFEHLAGQPWNGLPTLAVDHLDDLRSLAADGVAACRGESLVHLDVRADNMLVRPDGSVVLLDWPWACRGAAWLDSVALLVNVGLYGGHDPEDADGVDSRAGGRRHGSGDRVPGRAGGLLPRLRPASRPAGAADGTGVPAGPGRGRSDVDRPTPALVTAIR